jgi:hypothetical protein
MEPRGMSEHCRKAPSDAEFARVIGESYGVVFGGIMPHPERYSTDRRRRSRSVDGFRLKRELA